MKAFVKEVSITVYIQEHIQGVQEKVCPPLHLVFHGGDCPPPLRIVPRLRDSGGGQQKYWKMSPD